MEGYVDDTLETITKRMEEQLTGHLNMIDDTNNIKFTDEEESGGGLLV